MTDVLISQAVDEESMLVLAHDGDKLVHDAAGHAGIAVLSLLAQQGLVCRAAQTRSRTQLLNELAGGHLQSGRAGETPAQRHRGGYDGVKGRDAAGDVHQSHHTLHIRSPEWPLTLHQPRLVWRMLGHRELVVACLPSRGCRDESAVSRATGRGTAKDDRYQMEGLGGGGGGRGRERREREGKEGEGGGSWRRKRRRRRRKWCIIRGGER